MKVRISAAALVLFISGIIPTHSSAVRQQNPVISLRRTECYGTCPVYSLEIFENGSIRYVGKEYVAVLGEKHSQIPRAAVENLVDRFTAIDYMNLGDYSRNQTHPDGSFSVILDRSSTITSLRIGGKTKEIEDCGDAPESLVLLEWEIDRAVNSHRWLHGKDDLTNDGMISFDVRTGIKQTMNQMTRAAGEGNIESMRMARESGMDVNAQDESGFTALMIASEQCRAEAVQQLLVWEARVDTRDNRGNTSLIGAASGGCVGADERAAQIQIIRSLVRAGADPNARNGKGETSLMWIVRYGNVSAMRELLNQGASQPLKDKAGRTALDHARIHLKQAEKTGSPTLDEVRDMVDILEGKH
jgi:hypothetical protein